MLSFESRNPQAGTTESRFNPAPTCPNASQRPNPTRAWEGGGGHRRYCTIIKVLLVVLSGVLTMAHMRTGHDEQVPRPLSASRSGS